MTDYRCTSEDVALLRRAADWLNEEGLGAGEGGKIADGLDALAKRLEAAIVHRSWEGQVDRQGGASDPNDRREMGG